MLEEAWTGEKKMKVQSKNFVIAYLESKLSQSGVYCAQAAGAKKATHISAKIVSIP